MLFAAFAIITGFVFLILGADLLVKHSVLLAKSLGLSTAAIGVTVVAFGTSLPETVVSTLAALDGNSSLAISNVVGSNILNLGLILGVTVLIRPIKVAKMSALFHWPVMMLASCLFVFFAHMGMLGRIQAILLLLLCVGFLVVTAVLSKSENKENEAFSVSLATTLLWLLASVIMLSIGGKSVLYGVIQIVNEFGVTDRVLGLTVVALGTSLPELVASLVALYKEEDDIALGTVFGSNIYNLLGILGIVGLVNPSAIGAETNFDTLAMLGIALLPAPFIYIKGSLGRLAGLFLLGSCALYLSTLIS